MTMPVKHHPDILSNIEDDAGSTMQFLWDFYPVPMMVVRIEAAGHVVVEAVNPAQKAMLSSHKTGEGQHLSHLFPAFLCDELAANCARCVAEGGPIQYETAGGDSSAEPQWSTSRVLIKPIRSQGGVITHMLCIGHGLSRDHRSIASRSFEAELERRVVERTDELTTINRQLSYLATHDWLTETYNRRHLLEMATTEFKRVHRYGLSLGLLMLDIDHFKSINDEEGHEAGDQALQAVASAIRTTVRECDLVGRYGGDEFIIVLPETDLQGARAIAERLRSTLKDANLSISAGIATLRPSDKTINELINRADHLLLGAKRNGRNRIESASLSLIP